MRPLTDDRPLTDASPLIDERPLTDASPLIDASPLTEVRPFSEVRPLIEPSPASSWVSMVPSIISGPQPASAAVTPSARAIRTAVVLVEEASIWWLVARMAFSFGNPADCVSPVALRPPVARGLPLSRGRWLYV